MKPRAGFCPKCGERVTPFAAGCAICGADLDPRRNQPSRWSGLSLPHTSSTLVMGVVFLVLGLFAPLLGVLVCGWIAYDRNRVGPRAERDLALAFGLLALVLDVSPATRYGLLASLHLL